jgi:hypothetical protein
MAKNTKKKPGPRRKLPLSVSEIQAEVRRLSEAIQEISALAVKLESLGVDTINVDGVGFPRRAWKLLRDYIRKIEKEIDSLA